MSREITTNSEYAERLAKIIPSELIAAFIAVDGILNAIPEQKTILLSIVCVILAILVPIHLRLVSGVRNPVQLFVSTVSFAVWVFSIGGPFGATEWYRSAMGATALIVWTVIIPLFPLAPKRSNKQAP